jgi:class 3 adenylate cyclase/tetratricopeptide (TPR) repeat protein
MGASAIDTTHRRCPTVRARGQRKAPLVRPCENCGARLFPAGRFCPQCAHPVAAAEGEPPPPSPESYTPPHLAAKILTSRSVLEGERKQVTVLFADVAGFSSLAERLDPETIHLMMDGCFEILTRAVHRHEGTINQFTGDGIMALFGAPIAHEDHAVRALQAALSIQGDLASFAQSVERRWRVPFRMRLGINTGSVVVARIGDTLRMDYTAQGDTTNLAARLQQMAPAGTIWVGESTYRVARSAFEWRSIGPVAVKGRETPVGAYELVGRRALRSRFEAKAQRGLTRFIGRDQEFEALLARWNTARRGLGQVVSVIGEAGMGKSRLLYEFKERLAGERTPYLEGSCFTYGDSISYLPFVEVVKALFGLERATADAEARRQIDRRLAELEVAPAAVVPYLQNLLALPVDDPGFATLPPHLVRERTVTALTTLIQRVAARQPFVLIIEDVHWIDQATEEVLGALVEALPALPLLLVLVYRPEYLNAWASKGYHARIALTRLPGETSAEMVRAILHKPCASRVPLERLSPAQSTELVQELLGTMTIPPELEEFVVDRTDGNPFFIEELTLSLRESGDLRPASGGYVLERPVAALGLPTTVQGVLLARIDRLDDDLKQILQLASVIGRRFGAPVLAEMAGHRPDLEHRLLLLEDLDFIYPTTLTPQREYSFKHVLTQQAVYDALLRARREALHERVGRALEALYPDQLEELSELLAYHYVRSPAADKAVEYLDRANQKAGRLNAMVEAKGHFLEAMRLLDTLPDTEANRRRRITLLVNQALVFFRLFELVHHYEDLTRFEPIAVGLGDLHLLGAYYGSMSWYEFGLGRFRQSIATATRAAELCEAAGNPEGAAMAYMVLGWSYVYTGELDRILALEPRVERARELRFNLSWYTLSLSTMACACWILGRQQQAIAFAEKELRIAEEFKDRSMICQALWILAWPYIYRCEWDLAIQALERAVQIAPTVADRSWAEGTLGVAYCRAGRPGEAVGILARLLPGYRAAHIIANEAFTPWLGEAYWRRGDDGQARGVLEELLEIIEPRGVRFFASVGHRLLAEIATDNDPVRARAHFERSIAVLSEIRAEPELALALAGYGRLHTQLGEIAEARECFTRALALFEALGTPGEPDRVRRELAELPATSRGRNRRGTGSRHATHIPLV